MNIYLELFLSLFALAAVIVFVKLIYDTKYVKTLLLLMFIGYLFVLVYFVGFRGARVGLSGVNASFTFPIIRAVFSFHYGLTANRSVLNILLFAPFGFLLSVISEKKNIKEKKPLKTVFFLITAFGFSLSLIIELSQLIFRFGIFETDDILKNTAGAALGCYLYYKIFYMNKSKTNSELRKNSMTSNDRDFLINLIRSSVKNESGVFSSVDDVNLISRIIVRNGIILTVYPKIKELSAAENSNENLILLENKLKNKYMATLRQSVIQGYEGELVLKELCANGMNCIALKGWELRKLYKEVSMRQMADLDILIKPFDYKRIDTVMFGMGYSSLGEESSWKHDSFFKNEVQVEMHKRLTDDSGLIQQWEDEMWERAYESGEDHLYKMSNEDFYIFHFIHLNKDFMNGSLGLRRLIDTWLLNKTEFDSSFVDSELEKIGLLLFKNRITNLCNALMGETEFDENSLVLLNHAMNYGIYGTEASYKAGRIASMGNDNIRSGKIRSLFAAVFLPISRMKAQFPILEKHPCLLPFFWVKRIIRMLRRGFKKNKTLLDYSNISRNEFDEMKSFFKAGGVLEDDK